jgi:hypothetical protein
MFNQNIYTMKTLKKLFLLIAVTGLLFSCSKSGQSFDMPGMSEKDHKGHPYAHEKTFFVEPNGTDDTENLRNAFAEALVYGPEAVVQLKEGTYHIDFIEVREFYGEFRGAGKEKTVITTIDDLSVDALISQNLNSVLIRFVGGNVQMSNMTLKTPHGALSTGSEFWLDALVAFSAATCQYTSEDEYINAAINNVGFEGNWDNIDHGLKTGFGIKENVTGPGTIPLFNTDISITDCSFSGFWLYGTLIEGIREGKITAGVKNHGNIFDNIYYASLGIWSNVSMKLSVEGNTFFNPEGTRFGLEIYSSPRPDYFEQLPQTFPSFCKIEQNEFDITGGTGGTLINDRRRNFFPDESPMLVQVRNNRFNMSNNAYTGIGCFNMMGMMILHNRFTGTGQYGVRIMGPLPYPYNENGMMIGNCFSNTTYSITTVLLDVRTKNWKIIGGDLEGNVTDNGENNTIINMKKHNPKTPLGSSIFDNLEEIRDTNHHMRGH